MRVAIAYNEPIAGHADSEDVLRQVALVAQGLSGLGHEHAGFALGARSPMDALDAIRSYRPDAVFNLVEEFRGETRLMPVVAGVFEAAGIPYTGSPYDALVACADKTTAKGVLVAHGIPTPEWRVYRGGEFPASIALPALVKPSGEHASVGIDDGSVCLDAKSLGACLARRFPEFGSRPLIVEQYIEGREVNVGLLEHPGGGVRVLPIAEIEFRDWPEGKPRIVGYEAKWEQDAFEYNNTPRRFGAPGLPIGDIGHIALECWEAFGLRGYARVDMRIDPEGRVYVIEVNPNPCISPDSGFIASALEAGHSVSETVGEILETARPSA